MSTLRSKMGALLVKPALKTTLKSFDTSQYGGAPLLGLNGLVVKTHGSSKAVEVKNSILQCIAFKEEKINRRSKNRSARKTRLQRIINQEKYFGKEGTVMEFEKLKKIIAEVLNVDPDEITMETTFQDDLGADSLDVYQIIMGIEEEFDIEIPAETAEQVTTVEDAVEMIKNAEN